MGEPLLTIIVPVRGRNPYLDITLRNLSSIDDKRVEILILDNSLPEFSSLKLPEGLMQGKVSCASEKLTMTQNWFRGLTIARGQWMCFLGSDDGIVGENLPILLDFLENSSAMVVSTHPIFFQYQLENKQSWADLPVGEIKIWDHEVRFPSALAVLFPQFKHDLPVPYNRCVVRTSALSEYTSQFNDLIGVSPDDFLGHYISQKYRRGAYLELPVFIHGGSERSNGMQVASKNPGKDSIDFLVDSREKYGPLLLKYGIDCPYALSFEHYSKARFSLGKSHSKVREHFFFAWAEIFCELKHHKQVWWFNLARQVLRPIHNLGFRISRKCWSLLNFRLAHPVKNAKFVQDPTMDVEKLSFQLTLRQ